MSPGISRERMSVLAMVPCNVMTATTTYIDLGIKIFEVRGRTKVRRDDEIAGAKRPRDQFDRVAVFQRRAQQGVDQNGHRYAVVQTDMGAIARPIVQVQPVICVRREPDGTWLGPAEQSGSRRLRSISGRSLGSWSSSRIRSNANSTASWPRRRLRSAPGAARRRCYATAIRRFAAALNAASPSPGGGGGGGGAAGLISGSAWGFCRPAAALRPAIIRSACSASNSVM